MAVNSTTSGRDFRIVPERIADRATQSPSSLAVAAGGATLSYGELDRQANQLAHYLHSLGVGAESVVGVCLHRSFDMVVAALGILKAGGAYLPMDAAYPAERLAYMLSDSKAVVVVTDTAISSRLPAGPWRTVAMDRLHDAVAQQPGTPLPLQAGPNHLAYVIYTSGSTGAPKGVELTHANLCHLVDWHLPAFQVTADDRAGHLAGLGFDAAVWELWPYLTCGASVHLAPEEEVRNSAESLRDWLVAERISITFVATAMTEQLLRTSWPATASLRTLLTGADMLRMFPPDGLPFTVVNNYGPTECTVVATSGTISSRDRPDRLPTIGNAIAGATVYLLDEAGQPVEAGTAGELYIGGSGVARGYRFRPELTQERFVADPFAGGHARMYRTGDQARQLSNGEFAFLGRVDDQIKIRGYRIEPGEVIAVLDTHPGVRSSVVVAREDGSEKRLVAYVIAQEGMMLTDAALRGYLRQQLPEHLVPAQFVQIAALPINANGKLDRSALPAPSAENLIKDEEYIAPRNPVEEKVAAILAALLNLDRVGITDNFFSLGGHSLLGTQVISRVKDAFRVDLTLLNLFNHPTVAGMAGEIERQVRAKIEGMNQEDLMRVAAEVSGD